MALVPHIPESVKEETFTLELNSAVVPLISPVKVPPTNGKSYFRG
jgi:hypothetical protein